jgi:beta-lactamase regulating signal transducer with metallopeptidase domain
MTSALALLGVVVLHATWLGLAAMAAVALAFRRLGAARPWWRHAVALAGLLLVLPGALALTLAPRLSAAPPTIASLGSTDAIATISLAPATPWLGLAWLLGVGWGLLGLGIAVVGVARIRRTARPLPAADAGRLLARARRELACAAPLTLALSDRVGVPTLIGWLRPMCVLPAASFTTTPHQDLEWLLVHELAHVRRADIAWNWAQSFAEVALFFHPAARWLARHIRHERECCCDAAVARTPAALTPYVHALTRLVLAARPSPGPALSATGGTLVSRIERLIDPTVPTLAPSRTHCLALTLGAFLGVGILVACETEECATPQAPQLAAPALTGEPASALPVAPGGDPTPAADVSVAPAAELTYDMGQASPGTVNRAAADEPVKPAPEPYIEPGPWLDDPAAVNNEGC